MHTCFVENHAKLSENRDIHIDIPDFDSRQRAGGTKLWVGKCYDSCITVGMDKLPDGYHMGEKPNSFPDR
jgi:hypothetical protein